MSAVLGDGERVLLAWVHVSDLHVGQGDAAYAWNQELVLEMLRGDVAELVARERVPRPHAILVTGDIAFSGATRSDTEYQRARGWLLDLAAAVGLTRKEVFVVAGNHDVQRSADEDATLGGLVQSLRSGDRAIDAALDDVTSRDLLMRRMANYLAFASEFSPAALAGGARPGELFWCHQLSVDGAALRIVGLNTAILAADRADLGKLRLGNMQLAHAVLDRASDRPAVTIVLTHHPLRDGWLADEPEVASWLRRHAHIHLCGHVHEAEALQLVTGSGSRFIAITAGASHGEADADWKKSSHGYNVAALLRGTEGELRLAVWPRRWSPGNAGFRVDVNNVPDGQDHSVHELGAVTAMSVPDVEPVFDLPRASEPNLAQLLATLPVSETYHGRSQLLDGISVNLNRTEINKLLDLSQIVGQLRSRKLPDGRPSLVALIDNALGFAEGTEVYSVLLAERTALARRG